MQLGKTQALFANVMLEAPEAESTPTGTLIGLIAGNEAVLSERLDIYRNNIFVTLTSALRDAYPLIELLTGEDFTLGLLRSFIRANPPREAYLAGYGGELDSFIETFAPARDLPWLADIARLEWAMNEADYAPDDSPLTAADLQKVPFDAAADVLLIPRTSCRLLESQWPLLAIRDFCLKPDRDEKETLDLNQGGCRFMVYRPSLSVELVPLEHDEYTWLEALLDGKNMGDALAHVLSDFPDFNMENILLKHLQLETFSQNPPC